MSISSRHKKKNGLSKKKRVRKNNGGSRKKNKKESIGVVKEVKIFTSRNIRQTSLSLLYW